MQKRMPSTPRGSKSKGGRSEGGRSKKCVGYISDGRRSPALQVAGEDELAGVDGESLLVNVTSNYHVSVGVEPNRAWNGMHTPRATRLPACPALDKIHDKDSPVSEGEERGVVSVSETGQRAIARERQGSVLDDIAERSVLNFKRRFLELNANFSCSTAGAS